MESNRPYEELQNKKVFFDSSNISRDILSPEVEFWRAGGVFCNFKCVFLKTTFTTNYCHTKGSNSRNFVSMAIKFHRAIA